MSPFNLCGITFMPDLWKPKKNLKTLLTHIDEAADGGADVIASCEGVLDGYITKDLPKTRIDPKHKGSRGYAGRVAKFRKRQEALAAEIDMLNVDSSVTGLILQMPLPKQIDARQVQVKIAP